MLRLIFCLFLLMPLSAAAANEGLLRSVESYLQGLSTIKAEFVQIAPSGELATGTFFLKRPGKMRWQYDPPVPVLMVSTGDTLKYYDYELEQVSNIPLEDTLAGFLAQDDIRFDPKVIEVLEASAHDGVVRVKVRQKRRPDEGELTLEFTEKPMQLRNMILRDSRDQQTNISLSGAEYGLELDNKLFRLRDPNFTRNR